MTTLDKIEALARYVAAGTLNTTTASEAARRIGERARFEMMSNGRCYWYLYGAGMQGSESAQAR